MSNYYKYDKVDREKFITVNQLAQELKIWQGSLAQFIRAGKIPAPTHNLGGSISYYTRAEADKIGAKINEYRAWKSKNPLKAK